MMRRQLPRIGDLTEFIRFKKPELNPTKRRLDNALTIQDLRHLARRRVPRSIFDFVDGAADGEISMRRARQAFQDIEFRPDILKPTENVDLSCEILGARSAMPFGIAPTGFTRLTYTGGECAGAAAAGRAGIPFTLSTLGTASLEEIEAANSDGRNWFQLYVMKDREASYELVRRAAAAGFDTLFFTVDTPTAGLRLKDRRNGFSVPPQLTPKTVLNVLPKVGWWLDFLTTPKLEFGAISSTGGALGDFFNAAMDPTLSYDDLTTIRALWPGKLVVKGVQNLPDAKRLIDFGVDGIVLSNHGGRQLDRATVPFHLLPEVVAEVGPHATVMIDTGIMHGADIVASIALGAAFTLVGRAYLYGLMAGGEPGADRAFAILRSEIERTMKLLGVSSLAELEPRHVVQLRRELPGRLLWSA